MNAPIQFHYSLLHHNTFGFDVKADEFINYASLDELNEILAYVRKKDKPVLSIGSGSNLLFTQDFKGIILHSNIRHLREEPAEQPNRVRLKVGSGYVWDDFCAEMAQRGYYGTENLSYIPGEVGASAVQNIGAYGVEVRELIEEVQAIEISTGKLRIFENAECQYGYRDSIFKRELWQKYLVTEVTYLLSTTPTVRLEYGALRSLQSESHTPTCQEIREEVIRIRKAKLPDPKQWGNAGSFFKNPVVSMEKFGQICQAYTDVPHYVLSRDAVKIPAAWLIEQCGWKGQSVGGAQVYENQPLIIINAHQATPQDVIDLAENIRASVRMKFEIEIAPEVNYI